MKTLPSLEGKSRELRELFAEVANSALSEGRTGDEAIFKGLAVVKQKEQVQVKKFTKPAIPAHLRALLDLKGIPQATRLAQEELEDAAASLGSQEPQQGITSAVFNAKGQLVLKFGDGTSITTNPAPVTVVEHSVVVKEVSSNTAPSTPATSEDSLMYNLVLTD
jgi:hypothetical protein